MGSGNRPSRSRRPWSRAAEPRAGGARAGAAALLLLPLLLAMPLLPAPAAADVLPGDKAALLAFKAALTSQGGELLLTWRRDSDPCLDSWTGVRCSCDDFFSLPNEAGRAKVGAARTARAGTATPAQMARMHADSWPAAATRHWLPRPAEWLGARSMRCLLHTWERGLPRVQQRLLRGCRGSGGTGRRPAGTGPPATLQVCSMPPAMPPNRRVLQLNFGDPRITTWNALTGTISPALGNLTGAHSQAPACLFACLWWPARLVAAVGSPSACQRRWPSQPAGPPRFDDRPC